MPKLEHRTLNDRAYAALKKGLISGQFKPGQVLTIRQLASRYGISATPVREALQRLVAEGALELLRNRSVAVPPLTRDKLTDLRRIRCLLEGHAGELAMAHLKPADADRLGRMIEAIDADIAANNAASYLRWNEKFHFLIYERAGSPLTLRIIQDLWTQAGPFFNGLFEDSGYLREANVGHRKILDAIRRGDSSAVGRSIAWDISEAADSLMGRLRDVEVAVPPGHGAPAGRVTRRTRGARRR